MLDCTFLEFHAVLFDECGYSAFENKPDGVSKDDPRSEKTQWPCYGKRTELQRIRRMEVLYGVRSQGGLCASTGYHGKSAAQVNPVIVKKALEKLQADLPTGCLDQTSP